MIGKIDALQNLIDVANHKITTTILSAGTLAVAQTAPSVKSLNDIPITEIFQHDLSAMAWTILITSAWIIVQLLNFAGVFRCIGWIWRRIRARRN